MDFFLFIILIIEPFFLVLEGDEAVFPSADVTRKPIGQGNAILIATILELRIDFGGWEWVVNETR